MAESPDLLIDHRPVDVPPGRDFARSIGMPLGRVVCQLDPDPGRIWHDYESVFNAQGTPDDLALRRLIFAER